MVFCNNAVYCPQATAIDASGIDGAVFHTNYIAGDLKGAVIDGTRFYNGGSISSAFVSPDTNDYWPKPGSPLLNKAIPDFTPKIDFNRTERKSSFDVGAYESEDNLKNPGWRIQAGFKML
jgi:hypothetical protein